MHETLVPSLGQEDPLKKEIATHSSILAWRIPWTKKKKKKTEPGGLQSMGPTQQHPLLFHFFFKLIFTGV